MHPKQYIVDLAEICRLKNIKYVVISPGSRNAPLVEAFYYRFGTGCISIVDERSAGYFALGIARYTQSPVVLICTSGTAVLNYAPALAEAYYQKIQVIAITADRPAEWIDQLENQTIRQKGIYRNFIKKSFELPQAIHSEDNIWHAQRMINEAINNCIRNPKGPVHINVPLEEPLYDKLPLVSENTRLINVIQPEMNLSLPESFVQQWQRSQKIMIVHGQDIPSKEMNDSLKLLAKDPRITVIAENISNLRGDFIIRNSDLLFAGNSEAVTDYPEMIIYSGGPVVSKKLKAFLRKATGTINCRIGCEEQIIDTFKHVTTIIPFSSEEIYNALCYIKRESTNSDYQKKWLIRNKNAVDRRDKILSSLPFSDLKAFEIIMGSFPENSNIELGNSSVIRYSQFFNVNETVTYYSNRGVSGIDGCLSTAAGTALASGKLTIAIVGDLSFVYDSNALWNRVLSPNLKIIVINNKGGNIFHLINGPSSKTGFNQFIEAFHPVKIDKMAEAFGLDYFSADNENELRKRLPVFYSGRKKAAIMEIKTDSGINVETFYRLIGNKTG